MHLKQEVGESGTKFPEPIIVTPEVGGLSAGFRDGTKFTNSWSIGLILSFIYITLGTYLRQIAKYTET